MSTTHEGPFKVAVVQAAPIFLDRDATVERACAWIAEAAGQGARLIAFPEAFLPGYPDWVWSVPAGKRAVHAALYAELVSQSVSIPGPEVARLAEAARKAGAYVVMGLNERNTEASGTSLYNTMLFLGPGGATLGKHRKLIPTGGERLVWAQGDGSGLVAYDTPLGRLGGLICWEHYMPLARYALSAAGVQIHIAATWDRGEPWLSTLRHVAREGGMYVLGCCQALRADDIPERFELRASYTSEWINVGTSAIVDPYGNFLAGPSHQKQEILYAEVDPKETLGARARLDTAGHYARPDIFELIVRKDPRPLLRIDPTLIDSPVPAPPSGPLTGKSGQA